MNPPTSISLSLIEIDLSGFLAFSEKDPLLVLSFQENCFTALMYTHGS
jgi:hypothetical protein